MGRYSTLLLCQSQKSILKTFSVSKISHFAIATGNGATGAFQRLTKILRISGTIIKERLEKFKMDKEKKSYLDSPEKTKNHLPSETQLSHQKMENINIPIVYITPYEHHSNILCWQVLGCKIFTLDSDAYGHVDL